MRTNEYNIGGAVLCWTLSETNRDELLKRWDALGLASHVPEARTDYAALKAALRGRFGETRVLVRPLPDRTGYALVDERVDESRTLAYDVALEIRVDAATGALTFSDGENENVDAIKADYKEKKGTVTASAMGRALAQLAHKMGATALRETGGVYWLPEHRLDAFAAAAREAEHCNANGGANIVYLLRTVVDDDSRRALIHAVSEEAKRELVGIQTDLETGRRSRDGGRVALGVRAANERQRRAEQLGRKLSEYESVLGETLESLRESATKTARQAAAAAIEAAAGGDDEEEAA